MIVKEKVVPIIQLQEVGGACPFVGEHIVEEPSDTE